MNIVLINTIVNYDNNDRSTIQQYNKENFK